MQRYITSMPAHSERLHFAVCLFFILRDQL